MLTPTDTQLDMLNSDEVSLDGDLVVAAPVSRRGFGRHLLGASAVAVLFAIGKRDEVQAAPLTDTWKLGGNNSVNTDGTNYIGTINVAPLVFKTASVAASPQERMRILANGNVGIGVTNPTAKLQVKTGNMTALLVETTATAAGTTSVLGRVTSTAPGTDAAAVRGVNSGTNNNGAGVRGSHAGGGFGVDGTATNGSGVHGKGYIGVFAEGSGYGVSTHANNSVALYANGRYGVLAYGTEFGVVGQTDAATGIGVKGESNFIGMQGVSPSIGVQGIGSNGGIGVSGSGGIGVSASGTSVAVSARSAGYGVRGISDGGGAVAGVYGVAFGDQGNGVIGEANSGSSAYGVWGKSTSGQAGHFNGHVQVIGNLSVTGAKNFIMDHPTAPEEKYLYHAAVEAPEMKNVYDGVVTLGTDGTAVVKLPSYFEAINTNYRYQLTTMGGYAPVYIADKIKNNQFRIAGGKAGMEVSWQVSGVRNDAYARAHPMQVEVEKPTNERGSYLAPAEHGQPVAKGREHQREQALKARQQKLAAQAEVQIPSPPNVTPPELRRPLQS